MASADAGHRRNNVGGGAHERLQPFVVVEAMHGATQAEEDHQDTYLPTLAQEVIEVWAEQCNPSYFILWVNGGAGIGKSAISQKVVKELEVRGRILGSFFCSASSSRRSNAALIIPTLAAQIIRRIPSLASIVEQAFEVDPHLLLGTMETQAAGLIVEPFKSLNPAARLRMPTVILVDGLDEVEEPEFQQDFLQAISYININIPIPLHFIITSRPEEHISQAFDDITDHRWFSLRLEEFCRPEDDVGIRVYYKQRFDEISRQQPNSNLALGPEVMKQLVRGGSGSDPIVFASVATGIIGDPSSPLSLQERMNLVLDVAKRTDLRPLERLDLLFVAVLYQIHEANRNKILQLLCLILMPDSTFKTPSDLDALFCLPTGTIQHRIGCLRPILQIPLSPDEPILPFERAFTLLTYLFDKSRSERFGLYVDQEEFQRDLDLQIIKAALADPERMSVISHKWFPSFVRRLGQLGPVFQEGEFVEELMGYRERLPSLHPFALLAILDPLLNVAIATTRNPALDDMHRSMKNEISRRVQPYLGDFDRRGMVAIGLCTFAVFTPHSSEYFLTHLWPLIAQEQWKGAHEEEIRKLMEVDKQSGLHIFSSWIWEVLKAIARCQSNVWTEYFDPFRHLLADEDIVWAAARYPRSFDSDAASRLRDEASERRRRRIRRPFTGSISQHMVVTVEPRDTDSWCDILPYSPAVVSWLQSYLSTLPDPTYDERPSVNWFFVSLRSYIGRNWKEHSQDEPLQLLEKQWRERVLALDLVEELEFLMAAGPDRLFDYSRG